VLARKTTTKQQRLANSLSAPAGLYRDPKREFAEIYGGAMVGQHRMFLVSLLCVLLALGSFVAYVLNTRNNVAVPWLVEVNQTQGVINKPVRIEPVKPSDAVLKAELGRWVTKVFTIDRQLTQKLFGEANVMTRGLGTEQFTEFRVKQGITERLNKDASLQRRVPEVSVDVSQPGIAFIFLKTQESQGTTANSASASYRVTLKYELIPPSTEADILANPLGLYVTSLNVIEEGATR
jgi:type IV secretion system protein VirB5